MNGALALAGRLHLHPGAPQALRCERPMVSATMMRRLAEGRPARLLPDLFGSVFTLGAPAQRQTARRAVRAALGEVDAADRLTADARALALATVGEHLQRLALDLPRAGDPGWLRDAPLRANLDVLADWLGRSLFGRPVAAWAADWRADGGDMLRAWAAAHAHPLARALSALAASACRLVWPCRALDPRDGPPALVAVLAASLREDADFAEHPTWQQQPAETGPWTCQGRTGVPVHSAWDRLGARLGEVAALAAGVLPLVGALPLGPREGIAWSEMSRGLLVHWVRLDADGGDTGNADDARIEACRVLAPTEWNFHADGAFAAWLRDAAPGRAEARLAALALDPCVEVEVTGNA
jgi:hypothetical protein